MLHTFPAGYSPANYCRGCGRDFTGMSQFDAHRTGSHVEDTRRCKTEAEMKTSGLEFKEDRHGVPLWGGVQTDADRARLATLKSSRAA